MTHHEQSSQISYDPDASSQSPLELRVGCLTISGESGTGKTVIAEMLANRYGIPSNRNLKVGDLFRTIVGTPVVGYVDRELTLDRQLDRLQAQIINDADPTQPFILEGRLAGVIASEEIRRAEENNETPPSVVRLLFTGDELIRAQRVWRREVQTNPDLTLEQVLEQGRERLRGDNQQWSKLHPQLAGIHPHSSLNQDNEGNPIYDLVVDTTDLSVPKVMEVVESYLDENGYSGPRMEPQPIQPNQEVVIFPGPDAGISTT